jgi:hypothetical protein
MTSKLNKIAERNGAEAEANLEAPTMWVAIFNRSMALYSVLLAVIFVLWLTFR